MLGNGLLCRVFVSDLFGKRREDMLMNISTYVPV
jgi:hypothetical protein